MARTCPIATPDERRCAEIQGAAEAELLTKVEAALDEAHAAISAGLAAIGHVHPPPPRAYLTAVVHQALYCRLCGADPHTFAGGDPRMALALIRNAENVAGHHWGADIGRAADRARAPERGGAGGGRAGDGDAAG